MTWEAYRLADVADLSLGKMLDQHKNKGDLFPYLANINVRWGTFDFVNLREMRFEKRESQRYGLREGDIVMCEGGEPGRCAIWNGQVPGMMIQKALHRIRAKQGLDHHFLFYCLYYLGQSGGLNHLFTGSTIKHLPSEQLAKVQVPVPPFSTQRRIASILSAYDDLIEANRGRVAILEEMARRLFEEWFVHLRFPGYATTPLHDTPDGPVPEGWACLPLGRLVAEQRDAVSPTGLDSDTVYVGLEHLPRRSTTLMEWGKAGDVVSAKLRFRRGDVLFGKIRPYFHKVAIAPADGVSSTDAIVLRSRASGHAGLVAAVASSDAFVAQAVQTSNGTKMPRANWGVLARYPVMIPPAALLHQFNTVRTRHKITASFLHF